MSTSAPAVNERLAKLTEVGTSVWLDQIRRTLITDGELQRLIDEDSLRGVTSNPAIFEKAILGSPDYDDQLEELARAGKNTSDVYDAMSVLDVQLACDVMRPVWEATEHLDGYVSLEVHPSLARDCDRTLAEAKRLWSEVDRPNVMIKIPGTDEGVPAIEAAIAEGINVNVTLLFSVEAYERVAESYIRGMEKRMEAGESLDVHSVASFFVSRVDTEADKRLEALGRAGLQGRAGLANARNAYMRFKETFLGERYAALREAGAPLQRPLWASTGVKNPAYRDTMYVDQLAAPHTVNTMPMATLLAAAERAEITGATADQDPSADLKALEDAGLDLVDVTDKLLRDGIDAFVTSLDGLIAGVEVKREAIVTGRPETISGSIPDEYEPGIADRVRRAADESVARRIWAKEATLWAPEGTPEVANRLGWLTIADCLRDEAADLMEWARGLDFEHVALLGMGGSSLGPEVLRLSYGAGKLHVLDSTDAGAVRALEDAIDVKRTIFVVSSKSGGTVETRSHFEYFYDRTGGRGDQFVCVTDPGSPLAELAEERGFARVFLNDPDIGGRYSVLSYFGLVPAALAGIDVVELLGSAGVAEQACHSFDSTSNSGLWLGCALGELALRGRDKLTFVVDPPLSSFGLWVEQLVAESTGKQGRGTLPVADEPLGAPDVYGDDRLFVHVRNSSAPDEANEAAVAALAKAGQPVFTLQSDGNPSDLGRIFFFAEFGTAVAGWVLEINPFDQPNVQEAKDNTKRVLESGATEVDDPGSLADVLSGAAPPDYVAIMGYVQPTAEFDAAIAELRRAIRDRTKATTTFGYGPRFLHSTGQYHKGGPKQGRFVQLIADSLPDVPVPGEPYSFNTLKNAQATGDLQTLRAHDLPACQVRLDGDPAQAVRNLIKEIQ
jgi:transaldolase / glucose-6-phosphate isomerase